MAEQLLCLALNRYTNKTLYVLAKTVHASALKTGNFVSNLNFATRILVAYGKSYVTEDARKLFNEMLTCLPLDVICWNSIISGCVKNGSDQEAFQYFKQMQKHTQSDDHGDYRPDSYTISSLLSSTYCLEQNILLGEQLHGYAIKTGNFSNVSAGNALITLYARWCRICNSKLVFESMHTKNYVSWTALISGCAQQIGYEEESLKLFVKMMRENEQRPNQYTFASIFSSCGKLASLSQGVPFISVSLKIGLLYDLHIQNSILGFFSECGCIEEALATFQAITNPDLVSWNSLLKGYSQQGSGREALQVFKEMQERGEKPDSITFLSTISACKHTGMVTEGLELLNKMKLDYGIELQDEHISCVVDLLGRAGRLDEAEEFIRGMKLNLGPSVWRTLLGACRIHGRTDELAELASSKLLELEPYDSEAHIALSHIYAMKKQWNMVAKMRHLSREKGASKEPGCSWIEVRNSVHSFVAGGFGHPSISEIQIILCELTNHIHHVKYEYQSIYSV